MGIQSYFKSLKEKDKIIDMLLDYATIKPHSDYPFHDYIGINFTKDNITSLKFYFGFHEPITKELSTKFLDNHQEFNEYIPLWTPCKKRTIENTGFTFTLKINDKFEVTKGFHFRFPFLKSLDFPEIKQFKLIPEDIMNVGINFEYTGLKTTAKYYYYFHKSYNKEKFAVKYNEPFIAGSSLVEYTESDTFNKIIAWDVSENNFYQSFLKLNEWPIQKEINHFLTEKADYYNKAFYGFYDNSKVRSMYYHNYKKDNSSIFPGTADANFQVFTVKDFIENYLK